MSNIFLDGLIRYKNKCDNFFAQNGKERLMSQFNFDKVMDVYVDALVRHSLGGKRIRAYLVSLGYCLFSGFDKEDDVFLPSLSYELFQTGILAHDDIIDNSDYRRFKPSMHKDLGEGHDGISKSICVGDLGIVSAIEVLQKSGFDADVKLRAITHQNKVFSDTIAGELKDIEFSYDDRVHEKDILEMYRLKTAQYTVSGPLVLGGIFAGASDDDISKLCEFGDAVGISFQIRDDILGLFGDEAKLGKSITSDMCEGKKTVLVSHFDSVADKKQKKEFYSVYGKENGGFSELEKARRILSEEGCLQYAEQMCKLYTDKAFLVLNEMSITEDGRQTLLGLLEYMTSRNN